MAAERGSFTRVCCVEHEMISALYHPVIVVEENGEKEPC